MKRSVAHYVISFSIFVVQANIPCQSEGVARRFSIMSWNVTNFIEVPGVSIYPDRSPPRLPLDLAVSQKYARLLAADVIALQEVSQLSAAEYLVGNNYVTAIEPRYFDERRRSKPYDIFVTLSINTAKISSSVIRDIPDLAVPFKDEQGNIVYTRSGLYATLTFDSFQFMLVNVHLKAGCPRTQVFVRQDCAVLKDQIDRLSAWIGRKLKEGVKNIVVVGDFNRDFVGLGQADPLFLKISYPARENRMSFRLVSQVPKKCLVRKNIYDYFLFYGDISNKVDDASPITITPTERELDVAPRFGDHCPTLIDIFVN